MDKEQVGSLAWLRATHGRLSWSARLSLLRQVLLPAMTSFAATWVGRGRHMTVRLDELPLPDTAAVRHALQALEESASPSVLNHSMRTYLWGAALASLDRLNYDPEFLLVASLLHDLGMTAAHADHAPDCQCFAGQSAFAALDCMLRFGWPAGQAERLADAVALHMNGHLPLESGAGVEAHLLQQGTAFDVVGSRLHDVDAAFRAGVLERHPRLGFNRVFADFMVEQGRRRPQSRAALMVQVGLPFMIRFNPFPE